jgi:hypothetical protein
MVGGCFGSNERRLIGTIAVGWAEDGLEDSIERRSRITESVDFGRFYWWRG